MRCYPGRLAATVVLALVCAMGVASCGAFNKSLDTGAAAMLDSYVTAMEEQNAPAAAALTSAPAQAESSLAASFGGMAAQKVNVDVERAEEYTDGTATFELKTTWLLGQDRELETVTAGSARRLSLGWRIQWQPELLADNMPAGGSLRNLRTDARPSPVVLDRFGKNMLTLQTINDIVLDPAAVKNIDAATASLATIIEPLAPLVTPAVMREQLAAAGNKPITVVSVRESDMVALAGDPKSVRGVTINKVPQLVLLDRRIDSPVLDGVHDYWQAIRDATSGWSAQMVAPGVRPIQLAGEQGPPGPNVHTTIDPVTQLDALDAVVEVAQPASILVLDANTGVIRGSMRNDLAAEHDITISKEYTPGSTLQSVADVVNRLAGSEDAKAAQLLSQLGLDVDFTIPGVRPDNGQSGALARPVTFRPEDLKVSALNMGALGVAIARTNSIAPSIIVGQPGRVDGGELGAVTPEVLAAVSGAMKATAGTGDASDLTNAPGLRALVGTNGPQGPGWFVGIQGGRVIVVYCEGERSGSAALAVAQRFFTPRVHPQ
jgi:hypothetical protein